LTWALTAQALIYMFVFFAAWASAVNRFLKVA
jgi:hypothetical protein